MRVIQLLAYPLVFWWLMPFSLVCQGFVRLYKVNSFQMDNSIDIDEYEANNENETIISKIALNKFFD